MDYSVNSLMTLISHIHASTQDFTNKRLSQTGSFVSSHGYILYLLSTKSSMTMRELSEAINRDKSTTTVLVRKLKNQGLVKEEASTTDSRSKNISLTQKGLELNQLTSNISKELLEVCYKDFSEEEKQQLLSLLIKMSGNIDSAQ